MIIYLLPNYYENLVSLDIWKRMDLSPTHRSEKNFERNYALDELLRNWFQSIHTMRNPTPQRVPGYKIWNTKTRSEPSEKDDERTCDIWTGTTTISINGEILTAHETLERDPQLRGFLQSEKRISEKSLHAKLRTWIRKGKIPDGVISEEPPEFYRSNGALDGVSIEYKLDDLRIRNNDIVSIFEYLRTKMITLIETRPNTKVYLNVHVTMFQPSSGDEGMKGLRTGAQKFLQGTNPETVLKSLHNI